MAKNSVLDYDVVVANNTDIASISLQEGVTKPSDVNNVMRNQLGQLAQWRQDLGGGSTTAGTNTITVTANQAFTAYANGQRFLFKLGGTAAAGATTLNITPNGGAALGAKPVKFLVAGVATDPTTGQLVSGNYAEFQYDGTNMNVLGSAATVFATNAQAATATSTAVALTPANLAQERGFSDAPFINLSLVASVAASALTVAIKGVDGNDPSASNPVYVSLRSATAGSGAISQLILTAATSVVVSSGSTLGATNNVAFKGWIVAFNDAGTLRLGVINCTTLVSGVLTQYPLSAFGIASSTAEGGAGAADSAQTFYTGAAVTSKAYTVLGYFSYESGLAAVGTYGAAPTRVQMFDASVPLPGTSRLLGAVRDGVLASGSSAIPADNTIPQITEGTQFMSKAVTPSSAASLLTIYHTASYGESSTLDFLTVALFQDATANALDAAIGYASTNTVPQNLSLKHMMIAGTTSATTFRIRAGTATGTAINFNGGNGAQYFGGVASGYLEIMEIAA